VPRIELIEPVFYDANDPIFWEVDNLPLKNILRRQDLINLALDDVIEQIRDAVGTQGTVSNRLNQSINPDGSLKTSSVDAAMHSIEAHEDTDDYVRMTSEQSVKLDLIADQATNNILRIFIDNLTSYDFDDGVVEIHPSSSITPIVEGPNLVRFEMAFPTSAAHRHYYGLNPVPVDQITPDYQSYQVNTLATPFVEGSLRVCVNGVRIFDDEEVYVPGALVSDPWTLMSFTPHFDTGLFELSTAITASDVIRIDFDLLLV
jgi:hypothetical protein